MDNSTQTPQQLATGQSAGMKYCGGRILWVAVICVHCGCQMEELKAAQQPQVVVNNTNENSSSNTNTNVNRNAGGQAVVVDGRAKNKWVALMLCFFLGYLGAHKFYEDKVGMGILYLLTCGLFVIGWVVDFISLLFRSNPYYVRRWRAVPGDAASWPDHEAAFYALHDRRQI